MIISQSSVVFVVSLSLAGERLRALLIIIHCLSVHCCQLPFLYFCYRAADYPCMDCILLYSLLLVLLFIIEFRGELFLLSLCCCSGSLNNAAMQINQSTQGLTVSVEYVWTR